GRMRTLVLGGYGNFGARISRALAADVDIDLLVAGRDAARARRFADTLDGRAGAVAVDCNAPGFDQALAALDVDLVIHTAGPFQEQSYAVALAGEGAGAIADFVEAQRHSHALLLHIIPAGSPRQGLQRPPVRRGRDIAGPSCGRWFPRSGRRAPSRPAPCARWGR